METAETSGLGADSDRAASEEKCHQRGEIDDVDGTAVGDIGLFKAKRNRASLEKAGDKEGHIDNIHRIAVVTVPLLDTATVGEILPKSSIELVTRRRCGSGRCLAYSTPQFVAGG